MASFALGAAAGGITETLQNILAQAEIERLRRAQLAEQARQADMRFSIDQEQLGLGRERLGEEARQFNTSSGFKERQLGMEEQIQPLRMRRLTAETGEIERKPQAEAAARMHDLELAGMQGDQRLQQIRAQNEGRLREIGAQNSGAMRIAQMRQMAAPQPQQNVTDNYANERQSRILQSVDELERKITPFTTGMGSLLANIPATDARNFQAELDSLKANIAFGELTEMRAASKTGGALGQVSERELALLESALGALDPGQSPENFRAQLRKIRESIARWNAAKAAQGGGVPSAPGAQPAAGPQDDPLGLFR